MKKIYEVKYVNDLDYNRGIELYAEKYFSTKEKAEKFFTNELSHDDRRNDYFISGKYTWDYTLTAYNLNPTNQFIGLLGHPINFK